MTIRSILPGLLCVAAIAQPLVPSFEVASVKRGDSAVTGGRIHLLPGGGFIASNSTLQALIRFAYGVQDYQIEGPGWMATERYDIQAKTEGAVGDREIRLMLQNLLAARFGLKIRREVRQLPIYVLMVARGGPKLRENDTADSTSVGSTNHSIVARKATIQVLVVALSSQIGRPVVDSTGLPGTFDIDLEWTPQGVTADGAPSGPSIFTALREQLGLSLESRSGPVETIVVVHAEKIPSAN